MIKGALVRHDPLLGARRPPWDIHLVGMAMAFVAGMASAGQEPLWEIGIGGGAIHLPEYRGADRSHTYLYPFVLPYYRGEILQADETGIRGLFFTSDRIKLDVSLDGSVPVSSDDNPAREGMPDLHPTIQIGLMLRVLLWDEPHEAQSLTLNLPLRAAFAIDSGLRGIGYTSYPNLTYRRDLALATRAWRLRLSGGPLWGSERYHDYFYEVGASDATPTRPAYDAAAGYGGLRFLASLFHREGDTLVSLYALYDSVQGAVFADSPLVQREGGWTVGFLVSWFPFKSERMVETSGVGW